VVAIGLRVKIMLISLALDCKFQSQAVDQSSQNFGAASAKIFAIFGHIDANCLTYTFKNRKHLMASKFYGLLNY
jgi:hypothetical protein